MSQAKSKSGLNKLLPLILKNFREWPRWWKHQSLKSRTLPLLAVLIYWGLFYYFKEFRIDHINIGMGFLALSYGGKGGRALLKFSLPIIIAAVIYDSMRFYSDYIRGPVHVEEPYRWEKLLFGIQTVTGIQTPNEWWRLHTHPALDLLTGFAYLVFVFEFALVAAYFYFILGKKGTRTLSPARVYEQSNKMIFNFLWLNMLGWSTYYWFAAAPPWYVALHGLGPAIMSTPPNPAGCLNFDLILGTRLFIEMYSRSADVFGAIPSLHVAYPFLAVYYSFRIGALRTFCVGFYLLMCFSAVYLNHHYIIDVIWGTAYAALVPFVSDALGRISDKKKR